MKYLLIVTLLCYGVTYWAYRAADRAGDDFGAVFPALAGVALSCILSVVYVGLVFWNHRFW